MWATFFAGIANAEAERPARRETDLATKEIVLAIRHITTVEQFDQLETAMLFTERQVAKSGKVAHQAGTAVLCKSDAAPKPNLYGSKPRVSASVRPSLSAWRA